MEVTFDVSYTHGATPTAALYNFKNRSSIAVVIRGFDCQ